MFVEVAPGGAMPTLEAARKGIGMNQNTSVRSQILSHFIKKEDFPFTYGDNPHDTRGTKTP